MMLHTPCTRTLNTSAIHCRIYTLPHRSFNTTVKHPRCRHAHSPRTRPTQINASSTTVQFPPYSILSSSKDYDLRFYQPHIVVSVPYMKRDEGYDALGGYFDGRNSSNLRFAESQPICMTYNADGTKVMSLYVGQTLDGQPTPSPPPLPDNVRVTLDAAGGEVVAVYRFEGFITPETAADARAKLLAALQRDGLALASREAAGMFRVCQYGPLYSLGRVNDLLLAVNLG